MIPRERILNSRIMIVDDQESNVLLLERLLQAEGYTNVGTSCSWTSTCRPWTASA
jgi:CheY-like chemotaxis protein